MSINKVSIYKEDTILSNISSQIQRILKTKLHKPKQKHSTETVAELAKAPKPVAPEPVAKPEEPVESAQKLKNKNATNDDALSIAVALSLQNPNEIVTSPESSSSLSQPELDSQKPEITNTTTINDDALSIAIALSLQNPDESQLFDLTTSDDVVDDDSASDDDVGVGVDDVGVDDVDVGVDDDDDGIFPGTKKNGIEYTTPSPSKKLQTNITNNTPINTLVENTAAAVSAKLSDTANNKEYGINSNNTQPNQPLKTNAQIAATLSTPNNANTSATPPVQDNIIIAASVAAAVSAESQSKQDNTNNAAADVSAESQSNQDTTIAAAVYDKLSESQHEQDNTNIAASIAAAVSAKLSESQPKQDNKKFANKVKEVANKVKEEKQVQGSDSDDEFDSPTILTSETTNDMVVLYGDFVYKIDPKTSSQFIENTFDDNGEIQTRYLKLESNGTQLHVQVKTSTTDAWKSLDDDFYKKNPRVTEDGIIAALKLFNQPVTVKAKPPQIIKDQNGNPTLVYGNLVYIAPSSTDKDKWYSEFYTPNGESETKPRKVRINETTKKLEFEPGGFFDSNYYNNNNNNNNDDDEKITEDTIMQIIKH